MLTDTAPWAAEPDARRQAQPGYRDPFMLAIVAAAFAVYTALALSRYVTADPVSVDLGQFTEAVRQYAHFHAPIVDIKGPGFNILGDHFSPVLAVLAPLFRLFPTPATLLVAQAALTALSVVPVWRAAVVHLGVARARLVTAAYGASWGLASMIWVGFYEVCFAVPLVACSLSALVRGRTRAAVLWALPFVLVKEDQGFTVAAIGLVLVFACRARLAGSLLAAWGVAWSLLAVFVIIPHFNPHHVYPYWADGVHRAALFAGLDVKAQTTILLLLPVAFVALRSPLAAVALPSLLLRFVSSSAGYWGTSWHYSATAMPIVFAAAVDGLTRIRAARIDGHGTELGAWLDVHAPALMAAIAVALVFWSPLSKVWQPHTWQRSAATSAAAAAIRVISPGATVEASLDEEAALAARDDVYWWGSVPCQWILFDQTSGEWQVSASFIATRHRGVSYRVVWNRAGVWVFHRQP